MAQLTFRIFIPRPIHSKQDGALFWSLFLRHFPKHVPTRMGHGANPTSVFDPDDLGSVLKKWNRRNLYFDAAPGLSLGGQILRPRPSSTYYRLHTEIFVYAFEDDPEAVKNFLYESARSFEADYATAHILTKEYSRYRLKERGAHLSAASPNLGKKFEGDRRKFAEHLEKRLALWPKRTSLGPEIGGINAYRGYIRELYWLTVFGPPYVELFGRDRILTTPAHEVRDLSYGGMGVELAEGLQDTTEAWESFLAARARAKEHLNNNAFFDPKLPRTHAYDTPRFHFAESAGEPPPSR